MIVTTPFGNNLVRVFSDMGMLIRQEDTGRIYASAVDVATRQHVYTETETPIVEDYDGIEDFINDQKTISEDLREYSITDELDKLKENFTDLQSTNDVLLECVLEMSEIVYN